MVLAGFMRVIGPTFVSAFDGRILNVHPALLPSFPGAHAVADALAYGAKVTGVTVQIATAGGQSVESGPATQDPPNSGRWMYTTTQTVSDVTGAQVTVTASDRPGNTGTRTVTK